MKKGFTLTELLVVIAILAVMVVVAVPVISSITLKSGLAADSATAQSVEMCIDMWMNTEYYDEAFNRTNLYNSYSAGQASVGTIGGYSEQIYSYYYAGTKQLPGTELKIEEQIRHSVITAIKATSNMKIISEAGEQFIESPKAGAQYGFKYYYKIGRVNAERTDSTVSAFGNDEVYQYYVWLDQPGGNISQTTESKNRRDSDHLYVVNSPLYAFQFNFGARSLRNIRVEIERDGQSYTFTGSTTTPAMFGQGTYRIRVYDSGRLYYTFVNYTLNAGSAVINAN